MSTRWFDEFLCPGEVIDLFEGPALVAAMLRFESALAQAQAKAGVIDAALADHVSAACRLEHFDVDALCRANRNAGSLAIALIFALKKQAEKLSPAAAAVVHLGSTSQDVIDTAMVLQTKAALRIITRDLLALIDVLLALAARHRQTATLARTLMQPAAAVTFGLVCVQWVAPLLRGLERLCAAADQAFVLQLGGAAGSQSGMKGLGTTVARQMAASLSLDNASLPWHTSRDSWTALACMMGVLTGSLGKIGADIALLSQAEISELNEAAVIGRGTSSAMPHKHNPVGAMVAVAASVRAPQRVAALLAAMPQQLQRGLGNWQAELAEWPELVFALGGAARSMAEVFSTIQIHPDRMKQHLDNSGLALAQDAEAALLLTDHALAELAAHTSVLRSRVQP
jgi:3-carboxy-cis,cis-muconate cycloisomerase